jgi:hypothetical protein
LTRSRFYRSSGRDLICFFKREVLSSPTMENIFELTRRQFCKVCKTNNLSNYILLYKVVLRWSSFCSNRQFVWLINRIFSAKEQCFSLTTNQRTVLSASFSAKWTERHKFKIKLYCERPSFATKLHNKSMDEVYWHIGSIPKCTHIGHLIIL